MSPTYPPHQFARRAGVTIRALHYYDRLGLLKPSGRTRAGYRLYSDRDLIRLEQIVALKFIGFPLNQIRDLLNRKDSDLAAVLRQQRRVMAAKRDHLDRAMGAIERAEQIVASGQTHDWEAFRKIIEVIQMQNRKDWMRKYYSQEQLANLKQRWSPELQAQADKDWKELIGDVEAAIARHEDPAGETGRKLAERRRNLLLQFTGGDAGIAQDLKNLLADQKNWPQDFKKPYGEEVENFLNQATTANGGLCL